MTDEPANKTTLAQDGHVPSLKPGAWEHKGFVPSPKPNPQGGHVPTTGSGRPAGPPPNAPSGVSPPAKK